MRKLLFLLPALAVFSACNQTHTVSDEQDPTPSTVESAAASLPAGVPDAPVRICITDPDKTCEIDRTQFIAAWPKAWGGDYQAQRNVAYMQSSDNPAVAHNPVQGCAWRIVIQLSGHPETDSTDVDNFNLECGRLSAVEYASAVESAKSIFKTIKGTDLPPVPAPER
jgi:hypothetical protein